MVRLRESAGASIGVNFDPSHLFWQGMDPLACVDALGDAIFHVHAKDTGFQPELLALNGVLEPIPGNRPAERSWIFRSVGAGHPVEFWRDLVDALREAGYDGALSIEHEDPLLSHADGLELAVTTLRAALGQEGGAADAAEHSEVVVGLDVGTTGVKGIAVAPDGTVAAVAEHGYPLSTPQAGWSEQNPEDWWRATEIVLGALGVGARRRADRRDRAQRPDARARRPRQRRPRDPARDPLERPAHRRRVRRDRGAASASTG